MDYIVELYPIAVIAKNKKEAREKALAEINKKNVEIIKIIRD